MRRASNISAGLAVAIAVFGLGGVHLEVVGLVATAAVAAAAFRIGYVHQRERPVHLSWACVAAIAATWLCALQIVPIPSWLADLLNPEGMRIYRHGVEVTAGTMQWRPLSLDPAATADRSVRFLSLAAIAVWAANTSGRRAWRRFASWFVPLSIAALAVGTGLYFSGAKTFFGLYEPVVGFRGHSVFVSTNHGAAFYGFAALVAATGALAHRRQRPRIAAGFGAAAVLLAAASVALDSDGVLLALGIVGMAAVLIQWVRSGLRRPDRDVMLGIGLLAVLGAAAALWLDIPTALGGFVRGVASSGEHGERWAVTSAGLAAIGDYWRFGAGAGAVETVIPAYVDWALVVPASIPVIENDVLELLLAFGLPIGVVLVGLVALPVLANARAGIDGHRNPRYAVLLVVALYTTIIGQLHFPLFAVGLGVPMLLWLELLWARRSGSRRSAAHVRVPVLGGVGIVASLATVGVVSTIAHFTWFAPQDATQSVQLTPASHVPYVELGSAAARAGDLERAFALAETAAARENSPRVRLYRAQILAQADPVRGAAAFDELFDADNVRGIVLQRFVLSVPQAQHRASACAAHPQLWSDIVHRIIRREGPDAASEFIVELATSRAGDVEVYRLASATYLELGQPVLAQLWAEMVDEIETSGLETGTAPILLARALRGSAKIGEARSVLARAAADGELLADGHRLGLQMRGLPSADQRAVIEAHYTGLCKPTPAADRKLCRQTEAWLAEVDGDVQGAEHTLERVWRTEGDPHPLAAFLQRTKQCKALQQLGMDVRIGPDRDRIVALHRKCGR